MLPELEEWEKIVSKLGIKNNDHIVVYDNSDVLSASRCWFTFLYWYIRKNQPGWSAADDWNTRTIRINRMYGPSQRDAASQKWGKLSRER